jgi:hypothetical protein
LLKDQRLRANWLHSRLAYVRIGKDWNNKISGLSRPSAHSKAFRNYDNRKKTETTSVSLWPSLNSGVLGHYVFG